jgi:hypothetical protein
MFQLEFTVSADEDLKKIENGSDVGLIKQVKKALGYLQTNPKHPSLETHEYNSIPNPIEASKKVFEAYAQNKTPGVYRIFWVYGSAKKPSTKGHVITVIAITPHP